MFLRSSLCYLFSILICIYFDFDSKLFLLPIIFSLLLLYLFIKKSIFLLNFFILYCFVLFAYGIAFFHHYSFDATLLNKPILYKQMYATVYHIEQSYYYHASKIYITDIQLTGSKLEHLTLPRYAKLQYKGNNTIQIGDIISFTGNLYPITKQLKPHGFNFYNAYFYNKIGATGFINHNVDVITNIRSDNGLNKFFYQIDIFKNYLANQIRTLLQNDRLAAFLIAITLGSYHMPPHEDMINLQNSSLAHLISISGYHISLIALILFFCLQKILSLSHTVSLKFDNTKIAAFFTMMLILAYSLIVGSNTPALRAIITNTMICLAIILGFRAISLNTLFLAAVLIVSYNIYIIFSASFLLSFFATLAIILFMQSNLAYQKIQYFKKQKFYLKGLIIILFSMILTAIIEITIAPILAFYFSHISLLGSLSNLVCEPVFSFIVMPFMLLYYISPQFIAVYFLKIASYAMEFILYIAKITSESNYSIAFVPFYPDYIFTIIMLSIVCFAVFYHYKIKYLFLVTIIAAQTCYFITVRTPDIIVTPRFKHIALLRDNSVTYYKNTNSFLHNTWFGNKISAIPITKDHNFNCIDSSCLTHLKNYTISISDNFSDFYVDCQLANIILFLAPLPPRACPNATIIDTNKIHNHYAFIYLYNKKPLITYLPE